MVRGIQIRDDISIYIYIIHPFLSFPFFSLSSNPANIPPLSPGAAAAQVVPHVHFHIIPRPSLTPELRNRSFTMFGRGQRSDLDEDEAAELASKLRAEMTRELQRIAEREKL